MKYLKLLILGLALGSPSCIYINGDINYVDIVSEYKPEVIFQSNIQAHDSIEIIDSLLFKYSILIDTGKFYFADLALANKRILLSDNTEDSLWLFPEMIEILGDHDLTLHAYYKSYTESLADVMDAEYFSADTTWTITIYAKSDK